MDIRKPANSVQAVSDTSQPSQENASFKTGTHHTAEAKVMIPPSVAVILQAVSKKYNLPCDLSNISIGDGKLADIVRGTRQIADLVEKDSKLLPDLIKETKRILLGESKLQQFHVNVTKLAVKHQQKIDKATAELFLLMTGAKAKASKLEMKTNLRAQLKQQKAEAYASYYRNSVFGSESQLIDIEAQQMASDQRILQESKVERLKLSSEKKQKLQEYINTSRRS